MASEIRVNSIHSRTGLSTVSLTDTGAVLSGVVTATTFSGPLTGNVTGNITSTGGYLSGISTVSTTNLIVNSNNYPSDGPLSNRNKIINGDMRIDQRNAGAAVTVNTTAQFFPVDRFWGYGGTPGVYTLEQVEDAPAGFRHSIKGEVTTIDGSISATTIYVLEYRVEGYDMQDLEWGTADAKTITLSFWVKVSQAGTYTGAVHNSAQTRSYGFTWSVSSTNWERITITIPGDTTGTWEQTYLTGMSIVLFALGVGSTFESANSNQWEARSTFAVSGNTYLIGISNSTFNITGVQLEVGSVATPFEHRSFGHELLRCQRYYSTSADYQATINSRGGFFGVPYPGGSLAYGNCVFPTIMRNTPNVLIYDNNGLVGNCTQWGSAHALASTPSNISQNGFQVVDRTSPANFVDDARYSVTAGYTADAEL